MSRSDDKWRAAVEGWDEDAEGWMRRLRAANRSPRTLKMYREQTGYFAAWCDDTGRPLIAAQLTVIDIEEHLVWMYARGFAEGTVLLRYACLKQWFRFLEDRQRITVSPMNRMRPPKVTVRPVPILTGDQVRRMLAACEGHGWMGIRDAALICFLYDTGCRAREVIGMTMGNVHLKTQTVRVLGKGKVLRDVPIGTLTSEAMNHWFEARQWRLGGRELPEVWLARPAQPMQLHSMYGMVRRIGNRAGVQGAYPHRFRHTFCHEWLDGGGHPIDLMHLAGLNSIRMLARYGQSVAIGRAIKAHRTLSPGDRL